MISTKRLFPLILASLFFAAGLSAQTWTQFRGSNHDGKAPATSKPPTEWDASKFVWETELPGTGWSSPVYEGNRIWLTTAITTKADKASIQKKKEGVEYPQIKTMAGTVDLRAVSVDLGTGKVVHDISLRKINDPELINPKNSYASPTCAIADGKVVCHFGSYGTWCLDHETGKPIWETAYVIDHSVGPGSSAFIHNGVVILVCDGIDKQFVAAVELASGKEVWKTNRPPMRAPSGEQQKAYSTPYVIKVNGREQAVIPGAQWIVAYDPATGEEIWRADHGQGFSVTPVAVYESGLVVFSTGYMGPQFVAIDPTGTGDVTKTHVKWRARNAPTMSSFVAHDGKIFAVSDDGILNCLDAKSGQVLERKRIGGNFAASPILAGGNLYLPSENGTVTVVQCAKGLTTVAKNKFDDPILATPATVGDDLIVRTARKLYRIRN